MTEPTAVAEWIARHGGLVAGVARRVNPLPLVVTRPSREEALTLTVGIMAAMPAALDGVLAADALTAALQSHMGWRGVNHLIELGLIGDSP